MTLEEKILALYPSLTVEKIEIYIEIGIAAIKAYLNTTEKEEKIKEKYGAALIKFACNFADGSNTKNIKQFTQGSKSVTYATTTSGEISDDIKALLPNPFVKMMG